MDRFLVSTADSGETEHTPGGNPVREVLIGENVTIRIIGTLSRAFELIEKPEGSSAEINGTTLVPDVPGMYRVKGPCGIVSVFACEMACLDRVPRRGYTFGLTADGHGTGYSTSRMDQRLVLRAIVNHLNDEARPFTGKAESLTFNLARFGG